MWSPGWATGVLTVMEERGIKLRGARLGQGAPTGIEDCLSSGATVQCLTAPKRDGRKQSGMTWRRSLSRSRRGLSSTHPRGGTPTEKVVWGAEWNIEPPIQTKERQQRLKGAYPAQQPIHAEQRRKGRYVKSLEWNRVTPNRGRGGDWGAPALEEERRQTRWDGALNGISRRQSRQSSTDGDWGAPIIEEEHHWGEGGVCSSPPCVIDECSGFCSNTISHCGRAKFTSIFILRKHNYNLLSSGILRQHTMNSCSQKRLHLQCERLK